MTYSTKDLALLSAMHVADAYTKGGALVIIPNTIADELVDRGWTNAREHELGDGQSVPGVVPTRAGARELELYRKRLPGKRRA